MIETYLFRTEIDNKEYTQNVYSSDIKQALSFWIEELEATQNLVYGFKSAFVTEIKTQLVDDILIISEPLFNYFNYTIQGKIQTTYIYLINRGLPDFTALVYYLKTEEGGRKNYAASGYRPSFKIEGFDFLTSSEQLLKSTYKVLPGQTVEAEVRILSVHQFAGKLQKGMQFQLSEGGRVIATGKIIEVINNILNML